MVQHVELLLAEPAGPPQVDQKQQQVVGDDDILKELQGVGVHLEVPDEEEKHLGQVWRAGQVSYTEWQTDSEYMPETTPLLNQTKERISWLVVTSYYSEYTPFR